MIIIQTIRNPTTGPNTAGYSNHGILFPEDEGEEDIVELRRRLDIVSDVEIY